MGSAGAARWTAGSANAAEAAAGAYSCAVNRPMLTGQYFNFNTSIIQHGAEHSAECLRMCEVVLDILDKLKWYWDGCYNMRFLEDC